MSQQNLLLKFLFISLVMLCLTAGSFAQGSGKKGTLSPVPQQSDKTAVTGASEVVQAGLSKACAVLLEYTNSVDAAAAEHIKSLEGELNAANKKTITLEGKVRDLEDALSVSKSETEKWKAITAEQKGQIDRLIQSNENIAARLAKLEGSNKRWKNISVTLILWRAAELAVKFIK